MRRILLALLLFGGNVDAQQLTYETAILSSTHPADTQSGIGASPDFVQRLGRSLLADLNAGMTRLQVTVSDEAVRIQNLANAHTTVVPRIGDVRSIDAARQVYWTTPQTPVTTAIEGVGARLRWHRTGRMERFEDVDAEEVQFEIEMFPGSERTTPPSRRGPFIVSGEVWVAPRYQRYASIGAALWPKAVSLLPTLAELAELGLIVKSDITIDFLRMQVETLTSAISEQPVDSALLTLPAGFRRVAPPSSPSPRLVYCPPARYSAEAASQKIDGVALLEVTVRTDGSVASPRVVKSLGFGLDEAAIEAVLKWKYEPAQRDGRPVEVQVIVSYGFTYRERLSAPR
jgi:TonB family protein